MIELIVVIAIVAILSAIAVPSFLSMIQRYRIQGEVNGFGGDLQFARNEAIKRGAPVSLCISSNGTACLAGTDWSKGWIVYATDASGTVVPLRVQSAWTNTDTFVGPGNLVTFSRDGYTSTITATTPATFTGKTATVNNSATKCLVLNKVGRQQVIAYDGSTCK